MFPDEAKDPFLRHAEHYLRVLSEAESLYSGNGDSIPQGQRVFESEWANIERGQAWAAANYNSNLAVARLCKEYPFAGAQLLLHRPSEERIAWLSSGVSAARFLDDVSAEATHLQRLAIEYFDLDSINDEIRCYQQLADISRRIRDDHMLNAVLGQLANAYLRNKQPMQAVACLNDAVRIVHQLELRGEEALLQARLGKAYIASQEFTRAIDCLQQALASAQETHHRRRQAETLFELAIAHHGLKRQGEAIALAAEAAGFYEKLDDPATETVKMRLREWRAEAHYSCFISYSSRDREFAEKLHADLENKDVKCWFAPEDLKIGDPFRQQIDESIRRHDKLLLIISRNSIDSPWVEDEVEAALERERIEHRLILFPIMVDDAIVGTNQAWAAHIRQKRHIGDFCRWADDGTYQRAFIRLLRDLRTEEGLEL